jgi:ribosomal protein S18 acetylase RimI-like enzyme
VQLSAIAVKTGLRRLGLGRRLICEVADALRTQGAAHLVAGPAGGDDPMPALLRSTGFVRAGTGHGLPQGGRPGVPLNTEATWWELEL